MTDYDPEFEECFEGIDTFVLSSKQIAYIAWQAAKVPPQPEVKKLDLKGGCFKINNASKVQECSSSQHDIRKAGRERKDQATAEAAAIKMRKRDVLHAHATEFMGYEYEFKVKEYNYYPIFDHGSKKWCASWNTEAETISISYMTKDCAEYLCAALNDGSLVL